MAANHHKPRLPKNAQLLEDKKCLLTTPAIFWNYKYMAKAYSGHASKWMSPMGIMMGLGLVIVGAGTLLAVVTAGNQTQSNSLAASRLTAIAVSLYPVPYINNDPMRPTKCSFMSNGSLKQTVYISKKYTYQYALFKDGVQEAYALSPQYSVTLKKYRSQPLIRHTWTRIVDGVTLQTYPNGSYTTSLIVTSPSSNVFPGSDRDGAGTSYTYPIVLSACGDI